VIHLDGNSLAGILEEVFGRDMTLASGRCTGCGALREVGALHVYRAAGVVVRCPDCDTILMRIVAGRDGMWVDFRGLAAMQIQS
jgi:hypothetical protein